MKKLAIIGAGGFAREVLVLLADAGMSTRVAALFESADVWVSRTVAGLEVLPLSALDTQALDIVIAIGDPSVRRAVRDMLPQAEFPVLIHPTAVHSESVKIGAGSIICAGAILTCDISLGEQVQIDRLSTIGHDCDIGDFVTAAPGVAVSGNCTIGSGSYLGTNSCFRQKTTIAPGTIVGMGAVVTASIDSPGVYVGNPARRLDSEKY